MMLAEEGNGGGYVIGVASVCMYAFMTLKPPVLPSSPRGKKNHVNATQRNEHI